MEYETEANEFELRNMHKWISISPPLPLIVHGDRWMLHAQTTPSTRINALTKFQVEIQW